MTGPMGLEQELRSTLGSGYDVQREITGGGMSRVFLAVEKSLDRQVVIKLLAPELAAGVNRERFQREIQLAAKLQHPHIVPLFAAGSMGDTLYYTMPFIAGESLKHALSAGTKFSVRDTVRILHDVTDALAHAHQHGIVHRDIKPANVLRSGGHAVVTDFGVAKALNMSRPGTAFTASGMVVGTPAYMAPEQLAGDPAADHRVDLYAVGLLGYELLSGTNPFSSPSPQQTLASQLTRIPEQLNVRHPDVPGSLSAVIARCLAKDPDQRPQSAAQLLAELDSLVSISGEARSRSGPKLDRWTIGAVGLTVVVTGLVLAVLYNPALKKAKQNAAADSAALAAAPAVLSHQDSLDIARAVEARLAARRNAQSKKAGDSASRVTAASSQPTTAPADAPAKASIAATQQAQAMADSIRNSVMHEVMDSVMKMRELEGLGSGRGRGISIPNIGFIPEQFGRGARDSQRVYRFNAPANPGTMPPDGRGPGARVNQLSAAAFEERASNMGPPRRVFIGMPRLRSPAARDAAQLIRDSIIVAIKSDPRFVVLMGDTLSQMSSSGRLSEQEVEKYHVDMVVALNGVSVGTAGVQWQLATRDLTAHTAFQTRVMPLSVRLDSVATAKDSVARLVGATDSIVRMTLRDLHEMDRAPRRGQTTSATVVKDSARHNEFPQP